MKVALVGLGYFGRLHLDAWMRAEGATLAAVVEVDAGRAAALRASLPGAVPVFEDAEAMSDAIKPDIIDIATPPAAHLPLVTALAPRCENLICQKPFCGTLADARRATDIAAAAGARLIIHENFRHQPWHREAARLLREGRLGGVWQATFHLRPGDGQGAEAYLARQPYFQTMPRFLVHETAVHLIDVFQGFFGAPQGIYADLRRLNPAIAGEDAGLLILDWAGGLRAVIDGNRLADHAADNTRLTMGEMWLEGSAGTLRLDGHGRLWLRRHGALAEEEHAYDWNDRDFGGDCVYTACLSYLDAIRTGSHHPTDASAYLSVLEIEEAAYESAKQQRRIAL